MAVEVSGTGAGMKFGEFESSLAVSAATVAFLWLSGASNGFSPLFALALFALSQVGYFALAQFRKAGLHTPHAEYLFVAAVFLCFLVSAFAFSSFSLSLSLFFIPIAFCAPAVPSTVRHFISPG